MASVPTPVDSEFRFAARIDYFANTDDAVTFARAKRDEGFNVNGGGSIDSPSGNGRGFGVHWIDKPGHGWYG